ncbi:MAG: DNA-deoxyinosine glycosylase [Eubacterium sp.]|nr:DNA-deoxyinosine glycosylase [Eubacterium sp.]
MDRIIHPIEPVYNKSSKILILGSFPSVKSREYGFFYGHKQNRFWRVIAEICGADIPNSNEEKKELLLKNGIAVWDVIYSCEITGSADSTIKNAVPTDIEKILDTADIKQIFTNGKKADELYNKYQKNSTHREAVCLPSTSPANAAWTFDKLYDKWNSELAKYIK